MSSPLAIERVERTRGKKDRVRLRLSGRWLAGAPSAEPEALLVVQMHGRRHRFPAAQEKEPEPGAAPAFSMSFAVPDWAVPEQPGQAVLWIGDAVVPVPPPGTAVPQSGTAAPQSPPMPAAAAPAPETGVAPAAASDADPPAPAEPGRSGPLADLLYKETVSALHSELEQRTAELARLRGALAQTRQDLEARAEARSGLEAAHGRLRDELQRLTRAVADQRAEYEQRLATLRDERDHARRELEEAQSALRRADEERERAGEERDRAVAARDRVAVQAAERAERERAEAEERLARARSELDDHLATARSEFDQQLAEVRVRAEAETTTMLGAARAESESRVHAAEAQAAALDERLSELMAAEQRRADEATALREQLAAAQISRDAALAEARGLRAELERVGSEAAVLRERSETPGSGLSEAEQLLAEARALTEQLRAESSG